MQQHQPAVDRSLQAASGTLRKRTLTFGLGAAHPELLHLADHLLPHNAPKHLSQYGVGAT